MTSDKPSSQNQSEPDISRNASAMESCRLVVAAFSDAPDTLITGAFGPEVMAAVQACRSATAVDSNDETLYLPCRPVSPTESIEVRNRMTVLVGDAMRELWRAGGKPPTTEELSDRIVSRVLGLVVNVPGGALSP